MSIHGRAGQRVIIQRLGTLKDVKTLDGRKPDAQDREAVKLNAYVVTSDDSGDLQLHHIAYLRADAGLLEISAVVEACKANGGKAP